MTTLLIIYHSHTGGSMQMARAAAEHAQKNCVTKLRKAQDAHAVDVIQAQGLLLVTPENLGSMAGMMKDFFDRTYYDLLDQCNGKPYALMICAGSDGTGAVRQVERIATGLRLKLIAPALIVNTQAQTREKILAKKILTTSQLAQCAELGNIFAQGLATGIF